MGNRNARPWRQQPHGRVRLNPNHWFASSLVFCGVGQGRQYIDLVSGQAATPTGTIDLATNQPPGLGSPGVGYVTGPRPQASAYLQFANQTGLDKLSAQGAILALGYHTGTATGLIHYVIGSEEEVSFFRGCSLAIDDNAFNGNEVPLGYTNDTGGAFFGPTASPLTSTAEDKVHAIGMGWDGTNGYVFHTGHTRFSTPITTAPSIDANRRTKINRRASTSTGQGGNVLAIGLNRVPSVEEYAEWAENPWAILLPARRAAIEPGAGTGGGGGGAFAARAYYDLIGASATF